MNAAEQAEYTRRLKLRRDRERAVRTAAGWSNEPGRGWSTASTITARKGKLAKRAAGDRDA